MKANEAPEKLYFGERDKGILDIYSNRDSNDEVEFTRTDAFVEKACDWIEKNIKDYIIVNIDKKYEGVDGLFFGDFRKYIKGE